MPAVLAAVVVSAFVLALVFAVGMAVSMVRLVAVVDVMMMGAVSSPRRGTVSARLFGQNIA